jgi:hypothetical protein
VGIIAKAASRIFWKSKEKIGNIARDSKVEEWIQGDLLFEKAIRIIEKIL